MKKATLNQFQELLKLVAQSGIDRDPLQSLLKSGRFTALLKEFIESSNTIDTLMVTLDYEQSLTDMSGAGKYDWVNDDITAEHFPINKRESGKVELHIVQFGREMTTKQVLAELDKQDLRPAELPELLSLGATCPDLQRKDPLVALGSEYYLKVPYLCERDGLRELVLHWDALESRWLARARFVAVRK